MRILIQRVKNASVEIENKVHAEIGPGLLLFLGIHHKDTQQEANYLAKKCVELRLFSDAQDKMNHNITQKEGEILVVSQFTLYGTCIKGRRPEFTQSAPSSQSKPLYEHFVKKLMELYPKVQTGVFGADMAVHLINDGPVTFWLEKNPS